MKNPDPKFAAKILVGLLFASSVAYCELRGIQKQGGYKTRSYLTARGEALTAGLRFAWQTPYHFGAILQILLLALVIALDT